jgi:DNA invertase Pin-like site-specific DNA recombinase
LTTDSELYVRPSTDVEVLTWPPRTSPSFVAYLRVSTAQQGRSGLGLEAQRKTVARFIADRRGVLVAPEFVEVESGADNDRPKLTAALKRCRMTGSTLVVAKLDRLSRDAGFLMTLRNSDVPIAAADVPEATTLNVGVLAVIAQHEREVIGARTKAALAAAKARGAKLGGARKGKKHIRHFYAQGVAAAKAAADARLKDVAEYLQAFASEGLSLNAIARRLNEQGIKTVGTTEKRPSCAWTATAVRRALARLLRRSANAHIALGMGRCSVGNHLLRMCVEVGSSKYQDHSGNDPEERIVPGGWERAVEVVTNGAGATHQQS